MRKDFDYDHLVHNIKNIIDEKGLKQKAVAEKSGFTEPQFSNMMNCNRKLIRPEYLPSIANALGVNIDELFKTD